MEGRDGDVGQGGNNKIIVGGSTNFVIITCMVAASGGLLFGYDIGISGGVTSMDIFLEKFFPSVYKKEKQHAGRDNEYCKFDSQLLTLFTSSLYLAALVASFFAESTTRTFGRKASMCLGGSVFLFGAVLNGIAEKIIYLIIGRILLGIGVGYANQSVPVYLSEMAPARIRGALNMGFQMAITIGILAANVVNYVTSKIKGRYGWRISLALAAVPALIMTIGSTFLPDTPNSIIERGDQPGARKMLQKIRGTESVDDEFHDLVVASEVAKRVGQPWKRIFERRYRPQLAFAIFIPFFQQLTGINVIMFYAPVLFKSMGFGVNASLVSAVITGLVNVVATIVSIVFVDRLGRRVLFLQGGIQMIVCQFGVGILIGLKFGISGEGSLSKEQSYLLVTLICGFVAAFAWSWGPLAWLVPSEIFPLEIRSAGQSINVSINMFLTFGIAQAFLWVLCHFKFQIFFLFAGFILIMTIFIYLCLPETKNVPIEDMCKVWKAHCIWGKYIPDETNLGWCSWTSDISALKRSRVRVRVPGDITIPPV